MVPRWRRLEQLIDFAASSVIKLVAIPLTFFHH
jgi:hypothetical protein